MRCVLPLPVRWLPVVIVWLARECCGWGCRMPSPVRVLLGRSGTRKSSLELGLGRPLERGLVSKVELDPERPLLALSLLALAFCRATSSASRAILPATTFSDRFCQRRSILCCAIPSLSLSARVILPISARFRMRCDIVTSVSSVPSLPDADPVFVSAGGIATSGRVCTDVMVLCGRLRPGRCCRMCLQVCSPPALL